MNDLLTTIITSLISLIAGGGITAIITTPSIRQKAKADAMLSVQDVYQETINDLRQDKQRQREEFELRISDLNKRVESLSRDVDNLKKLKCYNLDCPNRQRFS